MSSLALGLAVLFAILALSSLSLLKGYGYLPARELKARARSGNKLAVSLWRARAYDESLAAVLWFVIGLMSALFFWQVARNLPGWVAVTLSAVFIWVVYAWQLNRGVSRSTLHAAAFVAPALAWMLEHLHVVIDPVVRFIHHHWPAPAHTGLFDLDDLLGLLQDQYEQPDNRVDKTSLAIALQALTFGHQEVGEIMTRRRSVKLVSAQDHIGPVLMTELHESGQTHFPVYEDKENNIVGTLSLHDLVAAKATGPVKDRMHRGVYTLQEEQPLSDTLEHILQPNRHLFIVLDDREAFVGVVTTEAILKQIIGQPAQEEPSYDMSEADAEAEKPTEVSTEVIE